MGSFFGNFLAFWGGVMDREKISHSADSGPPAEKADCVSEEESSPEYRSKNRREKYKRLHDEFSHSTETTHQ
ncbi:hypothetical protein TNCV_3457291 [Trichonephila clavipes]|nr:hypothetical protein TNCV_3457291 [Trichonephila clavipes]